MVCSSFNIQYQSTGVGALPFLLKLSQEKVYKSYFCGSMALSDDDGL